MAELKTYVCPNCGASTTNSQNCEYCGSLLVRFAEKGIDINETPYFDNSVMFPELVAELDKNLKIQADYDGDESVTTGIYWIDQTGTEEECILIESIGFLDEENANTNNGKRPIRLVVQLDFDCDDVYDEEYNKKQKERFAKFTRLKSFPLFERDYYKDENQALRDFQIDFGQDAEGAARLISELLIKVYDLLPTESYGLFTGVGEGFWEKEKEWKKAHGLDIDDDWDQANVQNDVCGITNTNDDYDHQDETELKSVKKWFSRIFG